MSGDGGGYGGAAATARRMIWRARLELARRRLKRDRRKPQEVEPRAPDRDASAALELAERFERDGRI